MRTNISESVDSILHEANELACRAADEEALAVLRRLPAEDFGRLLLQVPQKFGCLPAILPRMPSEEVQRNWTGNAGEDLFLQSNAFVAAISKAFERLLQRPLTGATILDYGCGWGRHLRLMYAFSPPGNVFGIDPWDESIKICRDCGVLGQLAVCEYLPKALPFVGVDFDLIYAFSVFTHLSEKTANLVQEAMRSRIKKNGMAAITVRPLDYWAHHREILPPGETIENLARTHSEGGFAFAPHNRAPVDGEITYGDSSMSIEYIKRNWNGWTVEGMEKIALDPHQVILFLKPA